jgi:mitochondrial protein import protein ZIM17
MFSSVSRRICAYPTSALLRNSTIRSRAPLACFHAPSTLRVATAARGLHWSAPKRDSHALPPPTPGSTPSGPIQIEQKLQITFTCTVEDCGDRSSHEFTRRSYEKGIVIVQCPGCKNRCVTHPIAYAAAFTDSPIGTSLQITSAGSRM